MPKEETTGHLAISAEEEAFMTLLGTTRSVVKEIVSFSSLLTAALHGNGDTVGRDHDSDGMKLRITDESPGSPSIVGESSKIFHKPNWPGRALCVFWGYVFLTNGDLKDPETDGEQLFTLWGYPLEEDNLFGKTQARHGGFHISPLGHFT